MNWAYGGVDGMTTYHILPPDNVHRFTWWIVRDNPANAPQIGGYVVDVARSLALAVERVAELEAGSKTGEGKP